MDRDEALAKAAQCATEAQIHAQRLPEVYLSAQEKVLRAQVYAHQAAAYAAAAQAWSAVAAAIDPSLPAPKG